MEPVCRIAAPDCGRLEHSATLLNKGKHMNIIVLNHAPNVGKTTIAQHLLRPRMKDAELFCIKAVTSAHHERPGEKETETADHFDELMKKIRNCHLSIIDVDAEETGNFIRHAISSGRSGISLDRFMLPVTKEPETVTHTINTIRVLSKSGIEHDRIAVVFNRIEEEDLEEDFEAVISLGKGGNAIFVDTACSVFENEIFGTLKTQDSCLLAMTEDKTDYRELLRHTDRTDEKTRLDLSRKLILKRLAHSATHNLDFVYMRLAPGRFL